MSTVCCTMCDVCACVCVCVCDVCRCDVCWVRENSVGETHQPTQQIRLSLSTCTVHYATNLRANYVVVLIHLLLRSTLRDFCDIMMNVTYMCGGAVQWDQ